ncbi:MAG: BRCT domain-containing protein [Planctomycetota bacterium]|jgi:hypothetical protein
MPARRRKQSNAMLYTLITFVGLFIAATTIAVIYYVKAEEHRGNLEDAQSERNNLANDRERGALGGTVGAKQGQTSWLGTMLDYLDQTIIMVVGGTVEPTTAEVKVKNATTKVAGALDLVKNHISVTDPNTVGLVSVIQQLSAELDKAKNAQAAAQQQLGDLQAQFDNANKVNFEKEQALLGEKEKLQQDVNDIRQKYDELAALLQQTTDERIQTLSTQLGQSQNDLRATNENLLRTQAELELAQGLMQRAQDEVSKIMPGPDREVRAYQSDGNIILIDDQTQVVHLNIGSDDHVYQGLTFSVYNRGALVPKDGRGKAEIEVFDVAKTYSAARIIDSATRKPILHGDIVANLIWDSDKSNVFVIAGEFDIDNNGQVDSDGPARIKALIERWGGRVVDAISIDTDFLVLGQQPEVLRRPTLEETEIDPRAQTMYEASLARLDRYKELRSQAQTLWIPVFTYERFLYFVGYKGQIGRAGAF